jgi:hypothetical protein
MSNHKLLVYSYSLDYNMQNYINNQIEYIKANMPDLHIEHLDESDHRLSLFSEYPDRFPAFILLKNDRRKNYIHSKMTNESALAWVRLKLG